MVSHKAKRIKSLRRLSWTVDTVEFWTSQNTLCVQKRGEGERGRGGGECRGESRGESPGESPGESVVGSGERGSDADTIFTFVGQ